MSLLSGYREKDAVRIEPMYAEDRDYNTFLTFRITYRSGESKVVRASVRNLGGYHTLMPHRIERAWVEGEAYLGILKTDTRLVFLVELDDGTVRLVQERAHSRECRILLEYCM